MGILLSRGGWSYRKAPKPGGRALHLEGYDLVMTPPAGLAVGRTVRVGIADWESKVEAIFACMTPLEFDYTFIKYHVR